MFIDKMINQGSVPVLEQTLRFTAARGNLIASNIANISTPGYKQKDLDLRRFQQLLATRLSDGAAGTSSSGSFDDINLDPEQSHSGILFHDQANHSMEQLMSDEAKNTLMHNVAIELLRQQFQTMQLALRERVS